MRKIVLVVGVVAISCAGMLSAGSSAKEFPLKTTKGITEVSAGSISVTKNDVDVSIRGTIGSNWVFYDKINTLRASNADQFSGFRNKSCLDFLASYGKQAYGKSAADAMLRLTNYGYWRYEGYYVPHNDSSHSRDNEALTMLTYMEEMWFDLHLGTFFDAYDKWFSFKDHPVSVKVGYFPYNLGRGISLGEHIMEIPYLGWDSYNLDDTRYPNPGILVHGNITKDIAYELYYSKHKEISNHYSLSWKKVHADKTDRLWTDPKTHYRGISKDTDLWAAKMEMTHQKDWGDILVQPYMMYVDSSENHIEFEADSSSRLGTVGMMIEYKKNRFSLNTEVAGQFGHQNVYAIDRNRQEEFMALDGTRMMQHTHVLHTNNYTIANKAPVNGGATEALVDAADNKGVPCTLNGLNVPSVTKNGDQISGNVYVPDGTFYSDDEYSSNYGQKDIYNSAYTGNARFRDGYRIDYRGFMAVADMKYEFEDVPVTAAAAGGYISGDKYPYNTEQNKRYKAFLPYGDYFYEGKYVMSQIVLGARKLPRPVDISYHHQYAFNNDKDMSNLVYLGTGVKWNPFEDKKKLVLSSNIMWFWEATTLKKWDKTAEVPHSTTKPCSEPAFVGWSDGREDHDWKIGCHKVGWKSENDASRMLGTELNFEAQYKPVANCLLLAQVAFFLPGQLYKDLDGQPNENTISAPQASVGIYGLGHDPVWRASLALAYKF